MTVSAKRMALALSALGLMASSAMAAPAALVTVDDTRPFPESLTSDKAGDIFFGSMTKGTIYRSRSGSATAVPWISSAISGMNAVLGVYADDKSNTLYACSIAGGAPPEKAATLSALRAFDLKTGDPKAAYPMVGAGKALCNDVAVAKDGSLYVADTIGGTIQRLKKGSTALEVWIKDPRLAGADGIAEGGDGAIYVNTFTTSRFFKVPVGKDGAAGEIVELKPSLPLDHPDGLRSIGGMKFLQAEGNAGRITEVTISGDQATLKPLKSELGLTSVTVARGKAWALNSKLAYRNDPKLKDQDPGAFAAEAFDLPKH